MKKNKIKSNFLLDNGFLLLIINLNSLIRVFVESANVRRTLDTQKKRYLHNLNY